MRRRWCVWPGGEDTGLRVKFFFPGQCAGQDKTMCTFSACTFHNATTTTNPIILKENSKNLWIFIWKCHAVLAEKWDFIVCFKLLDTAVSVTLKLCQGHWNGCKQETPYKGYLYYTAKFEKSRFYSNQENYNVTKGFTTAGQMAIYPDGQARNMYAERSLHRLMTFSASQKNQKPPKLPT